MVDVSVVRLRVGETGGRGPLLQARSRCGVAVDLLLSPRSVQVHVEGGQQPIVVNVDELGWDRLAVPLLSTYVARYELAA